MGQYRLVPCNKGYMLERRISRFFGLFLEWEPTEFFYNLEYAEKSIKEYQEHETQEVRYY